MMERRLDGISALLDLCVFHLIEPVCESKRGGSSGATLWINECSHAFRLLSNYIGDSRDAQQIELHEDYTGPPETASPNQFIISYSDTYTKEARRRVAS